MLKLPKSAITILLLTLFTLSNLKICVGQNKSLEDQIINIATDRQLFVDHYLIDSIYNLRLELHKPVDEGPVFYFDKPWEGGFSAYTTIIYHEGLYRAYYRGIPVSGGDGNDNEVTCYAESEDGIQWEKPNVGLYEINGSKNNNVVLANSAPVTHNFSPFIDNKPEVLEGERFKALGGIQKSGLIAFKSEDGIIWEKIQEEPVITNGMFDSQNVSFWSESEKKYVSYFRTWTKSGYSGFRSVGRATSEDFINWSETDTMTFGDTPLQHLYTNQTHPYFRAPQIYVAIAARFMPNRQVVSDENAKKLGVNPKYYKDCSDAVFMTTRGGTEYDRTFMESYISPGIGLENWVSRTNYPALNIVKTGPHEMSVYVNQDYAQPSAHLHRYSIRLDGFASLTAPFEGGVIITKPLVFTGNKLKFNFSTSAAGSIKVEFLGKDNKPISGFTLDECPEIIGNEIEREVNWKSNRSLKELNGKTVRMRLVMKDARLYSFKFDQ